VCLVVGVGFFWLEGMCSAMVFYVGDVSMLFRFSLIVCYGLG
jgi:hypothetical protein